MPNKFPIAMRILTVTLSLLVVAELLSAVQAGLSLKAEDVMTPEELKATGLSSATLAQKKAFAAWLNRYTERVWDMATNQSPKGRSPGFHGATDCSPAVESTIAGDFSGWEGETIFKLDNGQIWEQAEYSYTYSYSYRPEVTIYQVAGGCRLKVEDEDETILVRRIR